MDIHADLVNGHVRYDVINYFRSAFLKVVKMAENTASDGFESNLSGTVLNQVLGLLHLAHVPIFVETKSAHQLLGCQHCHLS